MVALPVLASFLTVHWLAPSEIVDRLAISDFSPLLTQMWRIFMVRPETLPGSKRSLLPAPPQPYCLARGARLMYTRFQSVEALRGTLTERSS